MKASSIPREVPELLTLMFRLKRQAHACPLTSFESRLLAAVQTELASHTKLRDHLSVLGQDGSFMVG